MQGVHLRKYGVQTTIDFELYEVDGVDLRTDWTPAASDCEVMKNEGASTQCTNTATDEGSTYSIVLTATEMQAARLVLKIVDAATKVFLDKVIMIETYGHASGMHGMDFDDTDGTTLTEAGGDGDHLVEAGGDGDHLTAINLPNQTMDITGSITGSLSGSVGSVTAEVTADVTKWAGSATSAGVGGDGLPASIALADRNAYLIESLEGGHTYQGNHYYVDPVNGDTHANGNRGGRTDPYKTIQDCHDNAVTDSNHDVIFLVAGHASTATTHTIAGTTTLSKRYLSIRGPGRDFIITRTGSGDTLAVTADGVALSGFQLGTAATGSGHGIKITDADFIKVEHVWVLDTQGDGVHILRGSNCIVSLCTFSGTGVGGTGQGVHIVGTAGVSTNNRIILNVFSETAGDSILIEQGTTNDTIIANNLIHDSAAWGINIGASSTDAIVHGNTFGNNSSGNITDAGTTTIEHHNRDWLSATVEGRTLDVAADGAIEVVHLLTGHTAQTGDNYARLGAPAGASVSADIAATKAETALIVADTNELQMDDVPGLIAALPTANENADGLLDRTDGVEPAGGGTERTVREAFRIILAACAGKLSGAATATVSIRDTNDSKNRIVATVDADGNRSAVTLIDT